VVHASIVAHITPYRAMLHDPHFPHLWSMHSNAGLMALNGEITRQAAMVAYIDDFWLMMIVTLAAVPLLVLMRNPRRLSAEPPAIEA
jgi:MFS transporter, DHA2 family, multidrug resistance protein